MKYYSMTLTWQYTCRFVFREWYSQTITTFAIGCAITLILAFFMMSLPQIKKYLESILFRPENTSSFQSNYHEIVATDDEKPSQSRMTSQQLIVKMKVIPIIYALLYAFLHVVIMIIMMSMNGYVILSIIVGYTAGFAVFSDAPCKSRTGNSCEKGCA